MAHDPDLRLLRAFVSVVERGGFSAAARVQHVSQPALSRRIGELEASLGVRLFHRTSRRVELTHAGEDLLARSRELLAHGQAFRERADAVARGHAGILRIGCAPMIMESVVAPIIASFRKRSPGIDLQLFEQGGERAQTAVLRGELHGAVATPMEPALQSQLLFPWRLLAVVPAGHRLARGRMVDLPALADEPILTLPAGFGTRTLFDAGCHASGLRPAIRLEAAAAQSLVAAAQAGYGVAIVPSVLLFTRRGIKALPVVAGGKSLGRWLALTWSAERPPPACFSVFCELLVRAMERDYPGREYHFAPAIQRPPARALRLNMSRRSGSTFRRA